MSDNPESAGNADQVTPPSETDSQAPGQPPSGGQDVDAIVKAVLGHPDFQKTQQSVKDKRIAEIQTSLAGQDEQIARLASILQVEPAQLAQAQQQLEVEDMVKAWRNGTLVTPASVPDQTTPGSAVDLAAARTSILTQTGLPENTPGFDDYLATLDWTNPVDATLKATTWAAQRKAGTRQPTAADAAPPVGGAPAKSSLEALSDDEVGALLLEAQKEPIKNAARRAELMAELERRDNT